MVFVFSNKKELFCLRFSLSLAFHLSSQSLNARDIFHSTFYSYPVTSLISSFARPPCIASSFTQLFGFAFLFFIAEDIFEALLPPLLRVLLLVPGPQVGVAMGNAAPEPAVAIGTGARANICPSYLGVRGIMGGEGHMMMMMMNERIAQKSKKSGNSI